MELIQGEGEFWAERILVEEQQNQEQAEHINAMRARLAEEQFFYHFSQEARRKAVQWEMTERAAYEALFRSAEHRLFHNAAQESAQHGSCRGSAVSWLYGKSSRNPNKNTLRISVWKQDGLPKRPEPNLPRSSQCHQTAQAQAQSLLAAERVHHQ